MGRQRLSLQPTSGPATNSALSVVVNAQADARVQ
nr:MAG TPA: hypothetical protein [Caudoviricetes sp.]